MTASLRLINPAGLYDPAPNGYSHVAIVEAPGRLVLLSGQGGEDAHGRLSEDFAVQLAQALDNLGIALAAAGARYADVARLTVLIVDHTEARLALLAQALRSRWAGQAPPACTLIPVPRLALDGMLVEIEASAVA